MGNCECGRLKGNPCGPLRPNTINVTMPGSFLSCSAFLTQESGEIVRDDRIFEGETSTTR